MTLCLLQFWLLTTGINRTGPGTVLLFDTLYVSVSHFHTWRKEHHSPQNLVSVLWNPKDKSFGSLDQWAPDKRAGRSLLAWTPILLSSDSPAAVSLPAQIACWSLILELKKIPSYIKPLLEREKMFLLNSQLHLAQRFLLNVLCNIEMNQMLILYIMVISWDWENC